MSENTDKRTATQKIEDLEKVVTILYQAVGNVKNGVESLLNTQSDVILIKDALKLLNKKLEAVIQVAAPESGITVASVSNLVTKMNVEDLTAQVAGYVANGQLGPADEVASDSYLVCEEYNQDGSLANPRIQFRLDTQDAATVDALKGKKVGETISFGDNKFSAKILEIYSLVQPKAPEAPAQESAPAETPAAEAPAQEAAAPAPDLYAAPVESPAPVFVPTGEMLKADGTSTVASGS